MTTAPARGASAVRDDPLRSRREIWPAFASLTLGFALLKGLGAFDNLYNFTATRYSITMTVLVVLTVLVTPYGLVRIVKVPKPLVFLVGWLLLSFAWSTYRHGFVKVAWPDLATMFAVVIAGQLLPIARYLRTVLRTGYVAIAIIFFALATKHSLAYTNEGLRGGFIHKSPMGAALVLTVAAVLCIEPRQSVRRFVIGLVLILLLLGQTTTGIASILLVLSLYVPLTRYQAIHRSLGRAFGGLMTGALVAFGAIYLGLSNALISLYGKDLTFSKRTSIWQGVLAAVKLRPLTGYGWSVWAALWQAPASNIIRTAGFPIAESHNTAYELLLRLGVVGLALYLWLLFRALRSGLRLTARGDQAGIFSVLLVAIVLIWGFSESLPASGVWIGLLAVAAVPRPLNDVTEDGARGARRRFLAPRSAHAH
jgi:O-antigen ligase